MLELGAVLFVTCSSLFPLDSFGIAMLVLLKGCFLFETSLWAVGAARDEARSTGRIHVFACVCIFAFSCAFFSTNLLILSLLRYLELFYILLSPS